MSTAGIYTIGVVCTVGVGPEKGGRARNEDNYLIGREGEVRVRLGEREHRTGARSDPALVLAVADGMGGHEDGETASTTTVQAIARLYGRPRPQDVEGGLRDFVLETHHRLRPTVAVSGVVKMGTTLTLLWVVGGRVYWTHVGDSRLYVVRDGRMLTVTRDQTRAEFARRDGRPEPQHPHHLSQNFLYGSRGLGHDESLRIDRGVDTGSFTLRARDRLLLCSDGLHGFVDESAIHSALTTGDAQGAADALVRAAFAANSEDNVTALVLDVTGDPRAHHERAPREEWEESSNTLVPAGSDTE
jgi:protein phosphatase